MSLAMMASPAVAQAPSPEAITAAKSLLEKMKFGDQFKRNFPQTMERFKPLFVQNRVDMLEKYNAMLPLALEALNNRIPAVVDAVAVVYAKNYSLSELNELSKFYDTPLGQRTLAVGPKISQESSLATQAIGKEVIGGAFRRVQEEKLKKLQPPPSPTEAQKLRNSL
ncbi:MAG: DUF2059 domain-containing protein [Afipia sp.]|nr:DUF2059 domain-containing protein [Afipia sp.]